MISPQEKAIELYRSFLRLEKFPGGAVPGRIAKQCALICIQELMDNANSEEEFDFFLSTKQEIEKL
jgi:hypothetical protein